AGAAGGGRAPRPRADAGVAARRVALQDGASRLVRRDREGPAPARLGAAVLERGGALPHVRLVPGAPRLARGGGRDAPRAVEPAGARVAEADQLAVQPFEQADSHRVTGGLAD